MCHVQCAVLCCVQYFADKACQREIERLAVRCSNARDGCRWTGAFCELMQHLSTCQVLRFALMPTCLRFASLPSLY